MAQKVWIMHDTKFGNGKKLAESLKQQFSDEYEITIGDVKEITPMTVANTTPNILILGGAVRAFHGAPASKKWLKQLNVKLKEQNKTIQYGMGFLTHGLPTDKVQGFAKRFLNKIIDASMIEKTYSPMLTTRVMGQKGPIYEEEMDKSQQYIQDFIRWMK